VTVAEGAFVAFGLASQSLLVAFFAARRWWPRHGERLGMAGYGFAALGLPLAVLLALAGAPGTLLVGPPLMGAWALLGWTVDVYRPRPWRGPPIDLRVMVPFVGVYLVAQMWMWWPLWNLARGAWLAFLVLFVANTALNIGGHVRAGSGT
jgi:hypothetical protein